MSFPYSKNISTTNESANNYKVDDKEKFDFSKSIDNQLIKTTIEFETPDKLDVPLTHEEKYNHKQLHSNYRDHQHSNNDLLNNYDGIKQSDLSSTSGYLQYEINNLNLSSGNASANVDLTTISGNIIALQTTSGYLQQEITNLNLSSGNANVNLLPISGDIIALQTTSGYLQSEIYSTSGNIIDYINNISGVISSGNASSVALDDLTDVNTTGLSKNLVLKYNGSEWVPALYGASFTFVIATFTSTAGATTFEISTGTWKSVGALSFSATYTNGPATNGYVSHTGWSNLTLDGVGFIGPTVNTEVVTYPTVGGTKVFTLTATDGTDTSTSSLTYYFYNYRFWGVSSNTSLTETQIEALSSELSNSKSKTITVTAAVGEYIYFCFPLRLGTVTFTVGGFDGGFNDPETVSITNSLGYTEDYYVYRSTNSGLGSTTVVIS